MVTAKATSEGARSIGIARAEVAKAAGTAEAESLQARAEAFARFTEAAKLRLVLDMLPALAAEVCAPLAKTSEIVMIGESSGDSSKSTPLSTISGLGKDFMRLSATVPPGVRAITGVDLSKVGFKTIFSTAEVSPLLLSKKLTICPSVPKKSRSITPGF